MQVGGVAECWTLKSRLPVYRYGRFISPTFSTPLQTHTSDRPIFKISFDSENLGKLMRYSVAISLICAMEDPLNCYHIFWVKLDLNHNQFDAMALFPGDQNF